MRHNNDPDLVALRDTMADVAGAGAEPTAASVARTWNRITTREPRRVPRARPTWLALPATAAAVVAVVLVLTTALRPTPGRGPQAGGPAPSPTATVESTPTTPPTPAPTDADLGRIVRSVKLSQAVGAMVTASATVAPFTFGPGQLLYTRTDGVERIFDGTLKRTVREIWTDPNGMVIRKFVIDGRTMDDVDNAPATQPNLENPTPRWLARLTTNPNALYTKFAAINAGVKLGGEHYVSKQVGWAFRTYAPLLSPALRAAFFKVLGQVPGGVANQIAVAGHTYYGIRDMTIGAKWANDLLCDPATGQVVGIRYGNTGIEFWHFAVVDSVDETG